MKRVIVRAIANRLGAYVPDVDGASVGFDVIMSGPEGRHRPKVIMLYRNGLPPERLATYSTEMRPTGSDREFIDFEVARLATRIAEILRTSDPTCESCWYPATCGPMPRPGPFDGACRGCNGRLAMGDDYAHETWDPNSGAWVARPTEDDDG